MFKIKFGLLGVFFLLSTMVFSQRKSVEKGIASYYHDGLTGNRTANGERYDPTEMTAAHLTLPFDSKVKVINLSNHKSIIVRINDRGPFVEKRIIDLSRAAADSLGFIYNGIAFVQINVLRFGKAIDTTERQLLANNVKKNIPKNRIYKSSIDSSIIASIFKQPKIISQSSEYTISKSLTTNKTAAFDSLNTLWVFNIPKNKAVAKEIINENKDVITKNKTIDSLNSLWVFNIPKNKAVAKENIIEDKDVVTKNKTIDSLNSLWVFNMPKNTVKDKDVQPVKKENNTAKSVNDTVNYLWSFNIPKNNLSSKHTIVKKNETLLPTSFVAFRLPDLTVKNKENHTQNKVESIDMMMAFTKTSNKIKEQQNNNTKIIVNNIQKDTVQKNLSGLVYGVQIGSFKLKSNMLSLSEKLKKNYIDKINIQEVNKDNTHFYRLILGEFNTMAEAESLKDKIMNQYPQSFIISFNS